MSDTAVLEQKAFGLFIEKLLWLAGRFLHLIPSNMRMRVPFGINRGLLWIRGSANAPEWLGIYEYRKQRVLRGVVSRGATVCDIGANAGFYTLGMSHMVGAHGRVISFEPLPANLNKVQSHLVINKIDNVMLSGCALSDKTGRVAFVAGDSDFTGRISENASNTFEVPAMSLDDFISRNAIVDPTFLKIDVEGAEVNVLTGARELIARTHPTMLIALHGRQAAVNCYSILREAGYVITTLCGVEIKSAESIPADILGIYGGPIRPG
jgi:FkbM family methyltransferase